MALIRCDFFSDVLGLSTSMTVILPQQTSSQIGMTGRTGAGDPPVLYLLHGMSDDDTTWVRRTSIERYVAELGLAVIMPQAHHSFYVDEAMGLRYFTFLSEELPAIAHSFFRLSKEPAHTFVAGLSMGGYGALKWALRHPDRFAAAASLSGALDVAGIAKRIRQPDDRHFGERVFGGRDVDGSDDDVYALVRSAVAEGIDLPRLYAACGREDRLLAANLRLERECTQVGVDIVTDFGPGDHDWAYWDARIQDVLTWLPL